MWPSTMPVTTTRLPADLVQAGEVELDERLPAGLPHLKVRLAGELDRPFAGLGHRANRRHSECHYSKRCM